MSADSFVVFEDRGVVGNGSWGKGEGKADLSVWEVKTGAEM